MTDWIYDNDRMRKTFTFRNFEDAISFMLRVSFKAQALNHHPEWKNVYNRVFVELTTHSAKQVTELDKTLAAFLDETFEKYSKSIK